MKEERGNTPSPAALRVEVSFFKGIEPEIQRGKVLLEGLVKAEEANTQSRNEQDFCRAHQLLRCLQPSDKSKEQRNVGEHLGQRRVCA